MAVTTTESAAAYTRRTGSYPHHWSTERCARQDARIRGWEEVAARGVDPSAQSRARRALRAWGVR